MSDYDFADQLVPYSFFQSVIDLLPIAVDIINEEKTSVLSNEQFRKMFSWKHEYPFHQEIEQVFSQKQSIDVRNCKITTLSGNRNTVHLKIEPLFDREDVIGAIIIAKDITQIIAYQDEYQSMQGLIDQLKEQLASIEQEEKDTEVLAGHGVDAIDQHVDIKELQATLDYTSRDNSTWIALRDLRHNLKNRIPTYLYGELGVDKHQIVAQVVKMLFKQDIHWLELTKQSQIKDIIAHLQKAAVYTGVLIKEERLLRQFVAEIKERCKVLTIDKKGHCRWLILGNQPVSSLRDYHSIKIPPLRERKGDILLLADKILPEGTSLHEEVKKKFIQYHWPQNIRQLRSVLGYGVIMKGPTAKTIVLEHLPEIFTVKQAKEQPTGVESLLQAIDHSQESMPEIFDQIEKKYIEQVLQQQLYNITHTANKLGIKRQALQYKLKKYNLLPDDQNSSTH